MELHDSDRQSPGHEAWPGASRVRQEGASLRVKSRRTYCGRENDLRVGRNGRVIVAEKHLGPTDDCHVHRKGRCREPGDRLRSAARPGTGTIVMRTWVIARWSGHVTRHALHGVRHGGSVWGVHRDMPRPPGRRHAVHRTLVHSIRIDRCESKPQSERRGDDTLDESARHDVQLTYEWDSDGRCQWCSRGRLESPVGLLHQTPRPTCASDDRGTL
jgi:hypothetical protein